MSHLRPTSFAALFALLACGGSSGGTAVTTGGGGAAGAPAGACATDARAQIFSKGMEQPGAMKALRVRLLTIDPTPAFKGTNTWTIEVVDDAGAPIPGATVSVKPFMPDHGHGSSITPTVTELGEGRYAIASLVLFMPGLWETTIAITAAGIADSVVFSFCVAG